MKVAISYVGSKFKSKYVYSWIKLIFISSFAQVGVQTISFLCGIIIIRSLPINEYALYTLANTALGTMTILSDGGISSGILSKGGKVWNDRDKLGAVLTTGLKLRNRFAIGSAIVSLPILIFLLIQHEASWLTITLICFSIIPAFYANLSESLLVIIPKLHQCILPIQKNQIKVELGRLALMSIFILIFPFTYLALLANGIPRVFGNVKLKKIASPFANLLQPVDSSVEKDILSMVKRIMPGAIYFCVSSQITIWLISLFGKTNTIAQVGALGRLSMALVLLQQLIAMFVEPRFAKMEFDKKKLVRSTSIVFSTVFILLFIVVVCVHLLSEHILWVLGENYSNLNYELVLSMIGGCIGLFGHTGLILYISKGWVMNPVITIFISLVSILLGIMFTDVDTLRGILNFNIIIAFSQAVLHWGYFSYKILTINRA